MNKISLLGLVVALSTSGLAVAGEAGKFYGTLGADYGFSSGKIKLESQKYKGTTGGAVIDTATDAFVKGESKSAVKFKGPALRAGVGYNVSEEFRTDLALTYMMKQKDKATFDKGAFLLPGTGVAPTQNVDDANVYRSGWLVMMNGYYDFTNTSDFTPFIKAGIGYSSIKSNVELSDDFKTKKNNIKHSKSLAWSLGAGVSYKFADGMNADLGYTMTSMKSDATYKDKEVLAKLNNASAATVKIKAPKISHSVGLGLRVEF